MSFVDRINIASKELSLLQRAEVISIRITDRLCGAMLNVVNEDGMTRVLGDNVAWSSTVVELDQAFQVVGRFAGDFGDDISGVDVAESVEVFGVERKVK